MNSNDYVMIIGQVMGGLAVLLGFLSYQAKTSKMLLVLQTMTCLVFCIHYVMIGATLAFALNVVGFVRNIVYANRDRKFFLYKYIPILFAGIMGGIGILTWQDMYSLFAIVGLIVNTLCMSMRNPQSIRKSILVTSPLVLIYDVFVFSVGGIVYELVAIISAVIGIVRHRTRYDSDVLEKRPNCLE